MNIYMIANVKMPVSQNMLQKISEKYMGKEEQQKGIALTYRAKKL